MYEYDPKKFDDSQVFDDLKEISIGSMDFDNPKVYGDTSILGSHFSQDLMLDDISLTPRKFLCFYNFTA